MKKVLILAYDFPPYVSVGGLRPHSWYKYLKEFGVYPIVVTRQWGNKYGNHLDYIARGESNETLIEETGHGIVIRSPYKPNLSNRLLLKYGDKRFRLLRKAISAWYEFAQWLLPLGPKYGIYKTAKKYLNINKVDCIIATGDPFVLFRYAEKLSKKNNIPWIADYRDPWIQDKTREKNWLHAAFDRYFEKKLSLNASSLITVSSYVVALINNLENNRRFHIIPNGFDFCKPDQEIPIAQKCDKLTIAFMGTIYNWHPIELFLVTLNENIVAYKAEFELVFIGINEEMNIKEMIRDKLHNIKDFVFFYPRQENHTLFEVLKNAHIFLLFNDYSILGTKIFDYLALKRKILLCFSNDPDAEALKRKHYNLKEFPHLSKSLQADMITATNSGIVVRNAQHLQVVLKELWAEFKEKGYIECNSHGIEQYSRKKQTDKLAEIIKKVVDEHKQKHV